MPELCVGHACFYHVQGDSGWGHNRCCGLPCARAEPSWWLKPGLHLSYMEEVPPYPYQRVKRIDGRDTGVLAIIAPFYDLDYYRVGGRSSSACCVTE